MFDWAPDQQEAVRCLTGIPVANVDLEIIGFDGKALPHDGKSAGEVVARSPWLTQGYYRDQEKSEELWYDGWLHTGDIGTIDSDGYLKITDRLKDIIKTGGEWISSLDLEDILSRHEAVSEAAVIGVPDEKWGERPLALVVLKASGQQHIDADHLRQYCLEFVSEGVIPKYGIPEQIVFVEAIPKTSVGKINKKEIRIRYIK